MPQGPPELHEKWKDDGIARRYLEDRGYKLTRQFFWQQPSPDHEPTQNEMEAMYYLIAEWDYGGIETEEMRIEEATSAGLDHPRDHPEER